MKTGNCKSCKTYRTCRKPCWVVQAELNRIDNGRKKKYIVIIYESEMTGSQERWWNAMLYGADQGIDDATK